LEAGILNSSWIWNVWNFCSQYSGF